MLFRLYPPYFKLLGCWLHYSAHPWASPLTGLLQNLLPADLSLTPGTILSKLLGIHSVAAYKQLELFRVYTPTNNDKSH
ncbi:hypothetical protein C5188_17930 [Serratia liquefaciens]|nr:hypothetical protein C5188_17930 [Serratia liquefaciens]